MRAWSCKCYILSLLLYEARNIEGNTVCLRPNTKEVIKNHNETMLVKIADRTETTKIVFQDEPLAYVAHRRYVSIW